ncbi:hypothetical protein QQF64_018156 [Cirrhinus molitorella]|uniref:Uncharacterized protein n=1 Tax=Cirrhinus molitorella TaxID=172907 RepID=A0ABR3LKP6_9TELE
MKPLKDHEEGLENKLTETKVKEDSLHERKLDDKERFLDEKLKELEMRERELTQRDARSSEHHQTTEDTAGAELKSIGNAQASGSLDTVRRSSMEFNPPSMSQDIDCDTDQKFIAETFHKL